MTLQEKLTKRKYRIPNKFIYFLYWFIMTKFVMKKYNPKVTVKDDINKCDGACFLVFNHLSRLDHAYLMAATYPRRINIVAGYVEFFRSHLHTVFRLNNILPKKIFATDMPGIKAMMSIINQGGCVCFSPEGTSSIFGNNQPVVPGTGKFLKHFRVPVYYGELRGQYLTSTKHYLEERKGCTEVTLSVLFTPEQLEAMTGDEIDAKLNEVFRHDDYEWAWENGIRYDTHGRSCEALDTICYRCPKCGGENMKSSGDSISCPDCGNGARLDDFYKFIPFSDDCVIPASALRWVEGERERIIRDIRNDPGYSLSFRCRLGYIPGDHWIPKKQVAEICGEGVFTVDHSGLHFSGVKLGEPFSFSLPYGTVNTVVIETDTTHFGQYVNGDYYEFFPEDPRVTGKVILLTEEMHRYHVNTWKNFPWYDYMYEGMKLGIDNENG